MNKTYTQVRDALEAAIKTVTTANGYARTLPAANFYKNYDQSKVNQSTNVQEYPKIFVTMGDVQTSTLPTRRKEKEVRFYVTVVILESTLPGGNPMSSAQQTEQIAGDIEKVCMQNYNLGGLVNSLECDGISLDSGFAHPEGIAIFELTVKWHAQY
jgi:hypothetical protein